MLFRMLRNHQINLIQFRISYCKMEPTNAFKYCPTCKTRLSINSNPKLIYCNNCGFTLYLSPSVCNALYVIKDDAIMLVRRKFEPLKGTWDVPGGFVDFDETIEESLIRESKEELGVEITNIKYITTSIDKYLYKNIRYHTLCAAYQADLVSNNINAQDDVSDFKFFKFKEIPYDDIGFQSVKEVLKLITKRQN